jgi:thiol-disulfide isomerase/thioredoxin
MRKIILLLITTIAISSYAQKGFVIKGYVPSLPDGTVVGVGENEDSITECASAVVKNGRFTLKGSVKRPVTGTLSTNNLDLVEKNHWPDDSIHWNYIDMFISNDEITVDNNLKIHGTRIQSDYDELLSLGDWRDDSVAWKFIDEHPTSVVSAMIVNNMLKRGYGLQKTEVERLAKAITAVPDDPSRFEEYKWRVEYARKTTVGAELIDLEIYDKDNKITHLKDVVPQDGRFVLIDFWASWCGQCLAAFPELEVLGEKYKDGFTIIDLSIDVKDDAWRKAMGRHPQKWPQYCTTKQGYNDLFTKYQIGNGVPYFVMIAPDGKVMKSPQSVEEIEEILKQHL